MNIFHATSYDASKGAGLNRVVRGTRVVLTLPVTLLVCAFATMAEAQVPNAFGLTSTANPVQVNQPVDLVATMPVPTGGGGGNFSITFWDQSVGLFDPSHYKYGTALCADVPAVVVGSQWVTHCVTSFDTTGTHRLMAVSGTAPNLVINTNDFDQGVGASTPVDANQVGLIGAWYNPATTGQGLQLSVFPDANSAGRSKLFGGWFTFDAVGHQRWVTLQGDLSTPHGGTFNLGIYSSTDGRFGESTVATTVPDGTATLTFYDCNNAALTYTYSDGRTGTFPYLRLGDASGCSTTVPAAAPIPLPANYNDVLHSGTWYDPATSAQGLNLEFIPSQTTFFATWYNYAPPSSAEYGLATQRWFTLQSNSYTPGDLALKAVPIYATTGGTFNTQNPVTTTPIGTADVTFTSCTSMTLAYTFTAGEFAGLSGSMNEFNPIPAPGCQ